MATHDRSLCLRQNTLPRARAFSLIELVIVVVIIGIVAAIAIPRFSSASANATETALLSNTNLLQKAIDLYAAEHENRGPEIDASGSFSANPDDFAARLVKKTNMQGELGGAGTEFGPYLRDIPTNTNNKQSTIHVGNTAVISATQAASTGWWYFAPRSLIFPADARGYQVYYRSRNGQGLPSGTEDNEYGGHD